MEWLSLLRLVFDGVLAVLGAAILARWSALALLSALDWWRRQGAPAPEAPGGRWPAVAVVIPAFNEERVLRGAVESALSCDYPELRVIIVDDGSTDGTWTLAEELAGDPRVLAVPQRPNQGKPAALDAGIEAAGTELVITVDADTVLARDAVRHLVAPLLHDARLAAVAGNVKVGNRGGILMVLQSLEYVTGLNLGRRAQHVLGCITTVPGAAGAWRVEAVRGVGGVPDATRIEDTDLTLRVQQAGWSVVYEPRAVAYTEAPETLAGLVAQRTRWIGGYLKVVWLHRGSFFRHGTLGWVGLPDLAWRNVFAFLLLPLVIPAVARVVTAFSVTALVELVVGFLLFDLIATSLAYVEDRERFREVLWVPVRRLLWPWFLAAVLVRVLVLELSRGETPWFSARRHGRLAEASREPEGPRIVR